MGWGRSGGIKKREGAPPPRAEPDGITVTSQDRVRVRDRAYLAELHARREPPLDLRDVTGAPPRGPLELHHVCNIDLNPPKWNDAAVVPLSRDDHGFVEMNPAEERNLLRLFGVWSAFSYWCFRRGTDPHSPSAGQQFLDWTIRKLKEEQ